MISTMKPTLCRICHVRAATGQAISKTMGAYAKPTPVCDKCGAEYEARQGRVEWKTKQRFLPDEFAPTTDALHAQTAPNGNYQHF